MGRRKETKRTKQATFVPPQTLFSNFRLGEEAPSSLSEVLIQTYKYSTSMLRVGEFPLHLESDFRAMMAGDPLSRLTPEPGVPLHDWARSLKAQPQVLPSGFRAPPQHFFFGTVLELVDAAQTSLNAGDKDRALLLMERMIVAMVLIGMLQNTNQMLDGYAARFEHADAERYRRAVRPALARHATNAKLKQHAVKMYEGDRNWKSARQAAASIYPAIAAMAKELGSPLSTDRGPLTVYGWLLSARKKGKVERKQ